MSWVPDFITDLANNLSADEATILLGLLAVAAGGLILPILQGRPRRAFSDREAEFRRLQNM